MHPIEKWHKLIKSNDPNKFDELLDENCTFYSPVVFTPIKGREMNKLHQQMQDMLEQMKTA